MEYIVIVGKTEADKTGRVNVGPLFRTMPEKVILAVDVEKEQIIVLNEDEASDFGSVQSIDAKNRITIPKWILEEVGKNREFFLVIEGNKRYLSPKTGDILPKTE